jgi:hypothetical protein
MLFAISVVYNGRMRQFVILDGKGITTWKRDPGLNGERRSELIKCKKKKNNNNKKKSDSEMHAIDNYL